MTIPLHLTQPIRRRLLLPAALTALVAASLAPGAPAFAATPTTESTQRASSTAVEDTYSVPGSPSLVAGSFGVLMAGDEGLDGREAFLRFPVPAVPADASNVTVSLVLHQTGVVRTGSLKVYSVSDPWSAATLTGGAHPIHDALLGRAPAQPTGTATSIPLPPSSLLGSIVNVSVTGVIGDQSALAFASTENTDPSLRPELVVDYVARGGGCVVSSLLVPSCGAWFGSTANPMGTEADPSQAVAREESQLGRDLGVVHVYHTGAQNWPTPTEIALVTDPTHPRKLMVNWKPEDGTTWAQVAAGSSDAIIDDTAARIADRLGSTPFFLTIHHEPENELGGIGSGFTPADYVSMVRHVVERLRADGVGHAVMVWDVMGFSGWGDQGLYPQLYPGDDVVDWIGYDPYSHNGRGLDLFANGSGSSFPGFYSWATTAHPGKPLMLAEFGVESTSAAERASVFGSFAALAPTMPALKAFLYFNHGPDSVTGTDDYAWDSDASVLAAARNAFTDPYFQP